MRKSCAAQAVKHMDRAPYRRKIYLQSDQAAYSEAFLQQSKGINMFLVLCSEWRHSTIDSVAAAGDFIFRKTCPSTVRDAQVAGTAFHKLASTNGI